MWINRTLCDVLEEMRKCNETLNFAPMRSLIEEAQIFGNRMEAGLGDVRDYKEIQEELPKLRSEYNKLTRDIRKLKK